MNLSDDLVLDHYCLLILDSLFDLYCLSNCTDISLSFPMVSISTNRNITKIISSEEKKSFFYKLPGRNTIMIHQQSSYHQHYRIHHNNLEPKIMWLIVALRKTRIHLRQPLRTVKNIFMKSMKKWALKKIKTYLMTTAYQL